MAVKERSVEFRLDGIETMALDIFKEYVKLDPRRGVHSAMEYVARKLGDNNTFDNELSVDDFYHMFRLVTYLTERALAIEAANRAVRDAKMLNNNDDSFLDR